jgi:uncharacterized protein YecE (DUF72 family)
MTHATDIHIGTSGWHYDHWIGPFYPPETRPQSFLEYYVRHFKTVEINNTFYRLPTQHAVMEWRDGSPPGFVFAAKGSRFITHMKKLKDPERPASNAISSRSSCWATSSARSCSSCRRAGISTSIVLRTS